MPVPREFTPDFWNEVSSEDPGVTLTCLLPNGITVLVTTTYQATMAEVKVQLWEEARAFPLYGKLQADMSQYIFKIINSMAEGEELIDESRRLGDVRPTGGVLVISECRLNSEEHSVNIKIGHLIGKGLQDFDALNSTEINDFRFNMRKLGESIAKERDQGTWQQKLLYQFPPRICETTDALLLKLKNVSTIIVEAKYENDYSMSPEKHVGQEKLPYSQKFNVAPSIRPSELLEKILAKKAQTLRLNNERVTDYVLKVCGRDEYLVKDFPLNQFQYVQDCIAERVTPSFSTVRTDSIPVTVDYGYVTTIDIRKPNSNAYATNTLPKKKSMSSSRISDNYVLNITTASKLNCDTKRPTELGIQVGLFHGGKSLCQPIKTDEKLVSETYEVSFDASIEFDIQVCNIPRCAKLCFVVYETNRYNKGTKSRRPKDPKDIPINPIAWANTSVYDFRGQLRTGAMTLYMWTYADDMMSEEVLHPLGTVVTNPNTDYATALTLTFKSYDQTITYPDRWEILQYAKSIQRQESITVESTELCKRLIVDNENLYDVHDQDRKNVWRHREVLKQSPDIFPKLLSCIDWDKRDEVSEVIALLDDMPKLPAEKALELLDYAYADQVVRSFAVESLRAVSDEDLLLYLLQLVQAIKHELYLECDLVTFLLERALRNQKIGHFLFWHLRSEMQVPAVSVRFGLILEAYCRGSQDHIPMLQRQIKSIEKLKKCYEKVKTRNNKEKAKAALKECLNNSDDKDAIRSPLDPSYRCSRLKVEKCRVMDSKMKPLWIVFENSDSYGDDVYIIFKNGDDLRQDMLTLQMIKIMDRLWKREGLDLRMNPYNCISLEHRVGMIQVVLNAETIANIQKEKNSAVLASFKKGSILAWLKDYNKNERALSKAIEEFTLSCAGYCVATYVLGIADRHPDNIMIKKSGQLFHIDFGHILGHFKEKFGIRREHAPFVLTHDFVHVINKGQKEALEFKIFQGFCERAFMILRKHGNLILSLFAMMISTGLPELTSEKDLQYLKETLVLSKTDDEALAHFQAKFNEALSNSWKTSLSWATHNVTRNNQV